MESMERHGHLEPRPFHCWPGSRSLVAAGLEAIGRQLTFPVKGIDSDNDSVFINDTLTQYCAERGIEFTRSRPYRKNDQAWIEQKNGAVVRHYVGHDRYSGSVAGPTMAHLYGAVRRYVNYFQPSFKLVGEDSARLQGRQAVQPASHALRSADTA